MSKLFNQTAPARVQKASFDLSHSRKLSANIGQLVPVLLQEVVPGDKFNINTQSMVRFAPLIAPVMHRMNSTIHYFFVPNRLIMEDWEEFITGKEGLVIPRIPIHLDAPVGGLADHLGLPIANTKPHEINSHVSALPFRAYYQVWNDYYRDSNLQPEIDIFDEIDNLEYTKAPLKFRAWEKDYFTSALPTPQRGLPVNAKGNINEWPTGTRVRYNDGSTPAPLGALTAVEGGTTHSYLQANGKDVDIRNIVSVTVDVEEIRRATRLQRFMERSMRAGNRYVEHLQAYWGVRSKDARLQRSEYIGGGKTPVVISDVANTTGTDEVPQGNLSGAAMSVGGSNHATKYVDEHGYIIAMLSILPETAYSQGIHRHWKRQLQLDYYFPDFAQLGEQAVLNQEIYNGPDASVNKQIFGYQSRFAEYKYAPSTVHGKFRTDLEFWHMGRKFGNVPSLNSSFITANQINFDPADKWRIFAVTEEDSEQLWIQLYHQITAVRPMPFLNDPTL